MNTKVTTTISEMENVDWALMLPGALAVRQSSVNTVWKGAVALSDDSETIAFIKVVPNKDLFVECACAVLGRQLGLNIPKPLIVLPDDIALNERGTDDSLLAFGSEDAKKPSFSKFVKSGNDQRLWDLIEQAGASIHCGIFDEWVGNEDRHTDNILYAGDNDFWFIDHETALPANTVATSGVNRNQMLENTICNKTELERRRFIKNAERESIPKYQEVNLAVLSDKIKGSEYLDAGDIQEIVDYLNARTIPVLTRLLKQRLNLNQKELAI